MVIPARSTGVMVTSLGFSTRPFTTYSRKACITRSQSLNRRSGFGGFFDEAGDGLARLRPFADPIFCALEIEGEVGAFLQWMIGPEFLDAFAVAGTAAVRDDDAKNGLVFRADAFHSNFD